MLFDRVRVFADAFARLNRKQLALIVPLVERRVLIEAFVALQTDELGLMHSGERFRHLGLSDASFALKQQRPLEILHQPECSCDIAVGNVANRGQTIRNIIAVH